jgi:hypothetical protein
MSTWDAPGAITPLRSMNRHSVTGSLYVATNSDPTKNNMSLFGYDGRSGTCCNINYKFISGIPSTAYVNSTSGEVWRFSFIKTTEDEGMYNIKILGIPTGEQDINTFDHPNDNQYDSPPNHAGIRKTFAPTFGWDAVHTVTKPFNDDFRSNVISYYIENGKAVINKQHALSRAYTNNTTPEISAAFHKVRDGHIGPYYIRTKRDLNGGDGTITRYETNRYYTTRLSNLTYTQLQLTEDDTNCYIDISGLNITDNTFPRYENMLVLQFATIGVPGQEVRCFNGGDWRLLDLKTLSSTHTSLTVDITVQRLVDWNNTAGEFVAFQTLTYQYKLYDMSGTLLQTSEQQTKPLAGTAAPATPYTFTDLSPNTRYKVRAIQLNYGQAGSGLYTVSTLLPPITVTASNVTTNSCRLTWGDLSAGEHVMVTTSTGMLYKLNGAYGEFGQSPNTSVTYSVQKSGTVNITSKANVTVLTLPNTPIVHVTNTQNNVSIAWTPVDGAASYKVYNGSTLLTTTFGTAYTNTSPVGTTLSLRVEAICPGNVSTTSTTVSATVGIAAPVISVGSHSAAPAQHMVINWSAISAASGYVIGYYNSDTNTYTDVLETSETTHTQTGPTPLKLYVRAKYGSVKSVPSNIITYTNIAPPTKLTAAPSSNGSSVTLSWTKAVGDSGSNTYYIYKSSGNQTGPQYDEIATTSAATITVTGSPTTTKTYLVSNGPVTTQNNQVYGMLEGGGFGMLGYAEYVVATSPTVAVTVSAVINPVTLTDVSVGNITVDLSWNQVSPGCTYHIQRTYDGIVLDTIDTQDTHVSIDAIVDPSAPTVYTVTAELNGVMSMAAGQQTLTLYNPPLMYLESATPTTAEMYFNIQTGTPVYRILNMATGAVVEDVSYNRVYLAGLDAGTTYTFGLQVQNSIGGSNAWSVPNTLTFTTPAAVVPITVASLTPNSATFTYPTNTSLSRIDVYMMAGEEYVFVTNANLDGNTFTVDSLTSKTVYNFVFRTFNANGVPSRLSEPLPVTTSHMPYPPTIAIEGANVVLTTADDDLTAITIVNADTDAVISTLAGNATTVSIASLTAGVADLQLNIQAIASNAYTANDTRSNKLALPVTPSAGSLSLATWITQKSSDVQSSEIKELTRSKPEAFSSSTASVSNNIVYKFLDAINPSFIPPATNTARFVNTMSNVPVEFTNNLDTLVYLNSNVNETIQLEFATNVYTVNVTDTGFTYNGTAYELGDRVVFDASFGTIIQGLGSLLLQPYNPSVTLTVNGVDYSILPTATGFTYNGSAYVVGDMIQFGGVSYTIQGLDPVTLQAYTPPVVPCFLGSARVLTPTGYVRIAALRAGDRVQTADGRVVAISRVSVNTVAATGATNPFVIPRGLYGAVRDIRVSPDHKILVDGAMIEARHVPGLTREEHQGTLTYYNLELPDAEDRMVVDGVVCESLAHVRRVIVTMNDFLTVLRRKYGENISPQTLQRIQHTCRVLADGRVDIPVMRR